MDEDFFHSSGCLVGDDLDHSCQMPRQVWETDGPSANNGWKCSGSRHEACLRRTSLSYTDRLTSLHVVGSPTWEVYRFVVHLSDEALSQGDAEPAGPLSGVVSLHAPGQDLPPDARPFRALILNLDSRFVEQSLRRRFGKVTPFEGVGQEFVISAGPAACLKSICLWMAHELGQPRSSLQSSVHTVDQLERVLLGLFLDCLDERRPAGRQRLEPAAIRQVRRVETWLDAHYADPVTIEDMARVAGVSVRGLQAAFLRQRDCTPKQALARRRLEAAHAALRCATAQTTVSQVAAACGFCHFGRFALSYRDAFGETPSATLSRVRPR